MNRGISQLVAIVIVAIVIIGGSILLYQGDKGDVTEVPTDDQITEGLDEIDVDDNDVSETTTGEEPISEEGVKPTPTPEVIPEVPVEEVTGEEIVPEPIVEDTEPSIDPEEPVIEEEPVTEVPVEVPEVVLPTPKAETAYVINEIDGTISVIDVDTEAVTETAQIAPGGGAESSLHTIILSPDNTRFYVSDYRADKVIVVKVSDLSVIAEIDVGETPNGLSTTPDGAKLYVANFDSNTVSVIDTVTHTVTATIPVDRKPSDVTVTPDGTHVFVTHLYDSADDITRILIIDTKTDTATSEIRLPSSTRSRKTVFTQDGTKAFISIQKSDGVGIIDIVNDILTRTISGMLNVDHMVMAQNGKMVYIVSSTYNVPGTNFASKVYVINTETEKLTRQLSGFEAPRGIVLSSDGSKLYVTEYASDEVRIFDLDADKVTNTILVGDAPLDIVIIPSS